MDVKRQRRAGRKAADDRGAAIVELLLTLPVTLLLLFGIIDFGFTFNDWIAVRQGGRDGLRQVLVDTATPGGRSDWTCPTPDGFKEPAPAVGSDAMNMVCFTKWRVGLDEADTRVKIYASAFAAGQPVKVCVQYKVSSVTGMFSNMLNGKILSTEVESLIEHPASGMSSVEENPLPGATWAASCEDL